MFVQIFLKVAQIQELFYYFLDIITDFQGNNAFVLIKRNGGLRGLISMSVCRWYSYTLYCSLLVARNFSSEAECISSICRVLKIRSRLDHSL